MELYILGTWATIDDSSWTTADAQVVCRQLGHSTDGELYHVATITYWMKCKICHYSGLVLLIRVTLASKVGAFKNCFSYLASL